MNEISKLNLEYLKNNDIESLLLNNEKLVHYIVRRYNQEPGSQAYEDLYNEGIFGLFKAIKTFDLNKSNVFSTYAAACIDNQIKMYLRKNKENVAILLSFDSKIAIDGEETTTNLYNTIEDNTDLLLDTKISEFNKILNKILNEKLDLKSRDIFIMSYIENKKQKEICEKYKITQSNCSRILTKTKKKIKYWLQYYNIDSNYFS